MPKRSPFITRTVCSTIVTAMVVDVESAEVSNQTVTFPRSFKTEKEMEAATRFAIDTDKVKFVSIVDVSHDRGVYGISETDFMAHAVRLADSRVVAKVENSENN